MGKPEFRLKTVWLQTLFSNMGWKISPEGDTLCGRACQSNSILGERGPTSPDSPHHKLGYVHMSCAFGTCQVAPGWLWDPSTGELGDSCLFNEDATSRRCYFLLLICSTGHCPTWKSSPACPAHSPVTFDQRPTPIDRFLSSSWSVSLPGWYSAAPKQ